ncbi:MAG: GNAT family N-acetyltransferase [Firmicutes bacterium]|nr:GNAT family N-acetyltransferase [Bacillota bacterium]
MLEQLIEIRCLTADDAPIYTDMLLQAVRDTPLAFGTPYEDVARNPHLLEHARRSLPLHHVRPVIGAFRGPNEMVGMVTLERVQLTFMAHKASVLALYVTPAARGQGVAMSLLEALLLAASGMSGLEQLAVSVLTTNAAALHLYKKLDFTPAYTEPHGLKHGDQYEAVTHLTRTLPHTNTP